MSIKEYLWVSKRERQLDVSRVGMIQLALPLILESFLRATVGMIDILFLSNLSDTVVSAVSISNQYITFCQIIAMSLSASATVCINQAIGMNNKDKLNMLATIAITANTVMGLFFGAVFLLIPKVLLGIMNLDANAIDAACMYLQIAGGLMIFQSIEIVLVSLCRSLGRIKAPLVINIIANLVNVVGNYIAVFHSEWLGGFDPIAGVALSTVLSRVTSMLIAMIIVKRCGVRLSLKFLRPFPIEEFKLVVSIGIPGTVNSMAYSLSQIVTTSIITSVSLTLVATKVYVSNIVQYIAIIGQAFANASSIMVGYRIGAEKYDEAKTVQKIVTYIALCSNAIISLVIIALRYPLLSLFTQDETIINIATKIFFIDFFVEIGRALNHCLSGALQAAGDVTFQLIVNQASAWIIAVGGAYLFAIVFNMGLYGIWIAFACDELIRGTILLWRWKSNGWLSGAKAKRDIIAKNS